MVATPEKQGVSVRNSAVSERVAVLLMGYGEVESYEDFANYNEQALNLLTAKFAPVPAWMYGPIARLLAIFDLHEWSHQHNNFISPHNAIFERQREGIERKLQEKWGDRVKVFKAFNFCKPFLPEQVVAQIREEEFDRLLIYPLLVVDSIFTSGIAVEQANAALETGGDADEHWLKNLRYIPSFYNEPAYVRLMAKMVEEKIAEKFAAKYLRSQIGIVLMNHGCPMKAKGFTSGVLESEALYERTRAELIHRYPLVSVGWLNHDTPLIEWTQPNARLAAENLIQLGAKVIVFMPIGFVTENHETLLDVHHIIHAVQRKHPSVACIQMPCANDNSEFLEMAADWADRQVGDLLSEEAAVVRPSAASNESHGHHHHHH